MNPAIAFSAPQTPSIRFGAGTRSLIGSLARPYGTRALVLHARSFDAAGHREELAEDLAGQGMSVRFEAVSGEPSPETIDTLSDRYREHRIDVVAAAGGGSVIDAGKAVSAMLTVTGSVFDYLEGVGTGAAHPGTKIPFIAVPTTAGTGSEATKNAVLSRIGPGGFKRSLRHDRFVPDVAVVDPGLTLACPAGATAASGFDAFTQLLESYVSTNASPYTDALAKSGLRMSAGSLVAAATDGAGDIMVRARMSYAALVSGITLAAAGLGVVHGLAASIGGRIAIPHGVVCGTLLGAATRVTIEKLQEQGKPGIPSIEKYATVGAILDPDAPPDIRERTGRLTACLDEWTETLGMPRLGAYRFTEDMVEGIVTETSIKNNPGGLDDSDIRRIIRMRL